MNSIFVLIILLTSCLRHSSMSGVDVVSVCRESAPGECASGLSKVCESEYSPVSSVAVTRQNIRLLEMVGRCR